MLQFTYSNLISSGVHIGHTIRNTLFMSSWMLYSVRQDIWIIDLFKTIYMFKIGFKVIKDVVSKCGPIWFINMDKTMKFYIKFSANNAGEFYICDYWCKGIVSNFREVHKSFRDFMDKTSVKSIKINKADFFRESWLFTRFTWPRFLFVSNVLSCPSSASEALNLGIGCLAIVDTNVNSQAINIAVPGNDESSSSIIFYNELVCNYILLCKFKSIILWFLNVRHFLKLKKMKKLLYINDNNKLSLKFDLSDIFLKNLRNFFDSQNFSMVDANCAYSLAYENFGFNVDLVPILLNKNWRFFSIISNFYKLRNLIDRDFFFKGLRRRFWKKEGAQKTLFRKLKLKGILFRNVKFGFSTFKFMWRFINRHTYEKLIKNDLWFSRMWSSVFLNYLSLFNQHYRVGIDSDLLFIASYKKYKRYLKKLVWKNVFRKSRFRFNWRRRFLRYLDFTSLFYYFKNNLLYYLVFSLRKLKLQQGGKWRKKKRLKFLKSQLLKLKLKLNLRLGKKKKLVLIKDLRKQKSLFRLGFWSFDNKIANYFYWKKIVLGVEENIPHYFWFCFDKFLGNRSYLIILSFKIKKSFKAFMFNKLEINYV